MISGLAFGVLLAFHFFTLSLRIFYLFFPKSSGLKFGAILLLTFIYSSILYLTKINRKTIIAIL